jgi:hypothetical protein
MAPVLCNICLAGALMNHLLTDHAAFRDWAAGAQSIAVVLAVMGGAIWTLFTFTALGSAARARRDLHQQAVVNISTKAVQVTLPEHDRFGIAVEATLTNVGNRNVLLDFSKQAPIVITPVHFDDEGVQTQDPQLAGNLGWVGALTLRTGASQRFSLVVSVHRQGLYYVEFKVLVSDTERKIEEVANFTGKNEPTDERESLWTDITYVLVSSDYKDIAAIAPTRAFERKQTALSAAPPDVTPASHLVAARIPD